MTLLIKRRTSTEMENWESLHDCWTAACDEEAGKEELSSLTLTSVDCGLPCYLKWQFSIQTCVHCLFYIWLCKVLLFLGLHV